MEDQKKTDVIKNIRTVLPPLNLKGGEGGEQSIQNTPLSGGTGPVQNKQMRAPPVSSQVHGHMHTGHPAVPHGGPGMGPYVSSGYRNERERERQPPMHMGTNRYRMHPNNAYPPYNPYGKQMVGYPPGRQPPHSQARYYPPTRQYTYINETPNHRAPQEKKPPGVPPIHHVPPTILMPDVGGTAKVQIKDAMRYLDIVKEEYMDNKEVYNKFLKTMKDYKERQIDAKGVIEIILVLFNGNQKLIQGFNQFLPKKYEILSTGEVKIHEQEKDKRVENKKEEGPRQPFPGTHPSQPYYMHDQRSDPREYKEMPLTPNRGGPHREYRPEHALSRAQYQDHRQDLERLGIGLKNPNRNDIDDTARVVNYLNKVRKHLENNPVAWFEFLRIVQSYKNNKTRKSIPEIIASVKALLKDEPALVDEFMIFLPSGSVPDSNKFRTFPRGQQTDSLTMLNDIKGILMKKGMYKEFVKALNMFNQGLLNSSSLVLVIEPMLKPFPALFSLFKYYIGHRETAAPPYVQSSLETYKKVGSYRILPEKYRQSMHTGQTPEDASLLNIDLISCPTFSSESSTFIYAKKNIHEEVLFRVEDERYESDLLIERISSLILRLMEYESQVLDEINYASKEQAAAGSAPASPGPSTPTAANSPQTTQSPPSGQVAQPIPQEGYSSSVLNAGPKKKRVCESAIKVELTAIDKELLSTVYGDNTDDIILGVIAYPIRAIPILLKQLRSIEAQWISSRAQCTETWRSIVDKNYIKSLDVKGYKIRNGERKTTLLKQFAKDLESAAEIEFSLPKKEIVESIVKILIESIDPEENPTAAKNLEMLLAASITNGILIFTPEIYFVLRGIASVCCRISEAINGKRIKPKHNMIAESLGLQEARPDLSTEEILSLVEEYALGNIENSEFEEKILGTLGISGTSLIGISGIFQNLETMITTMSENQHSQDLLERYANKTVFPTSNLSELLLKGINLVKITVEQNEGLFNLTATKLSHPSQHTSSKWTQFVKGYNTEEPQETIKPFLQRTLSDRKRKMIVSYGMEHLFEDEKYKIQYIPGTEDYVSKKQKQPIQKAQ
ncbi:paired amphipathic helix protein Sin3b [Nematocida sp. AWRm80]|nr:paired amphipathic helix protein Sin3b [Nematocida sp. AWRm80]